MFGDRVTLTVNVSSSGDGRLQLVAWLIHPKNFMHVESTNLTATLWTESDDVVRISLQHRASRTLAYLQGNRALRALCARLRLTVSPRPPAEEKV
jgi:hypothetical protein